MQWKKLGNIYCPSGDITWMKTHAAVPFVGEIIKSDITIFFSARDADNKSSIGAIVFDIDNFVVKKVFAEPFLVPGANGNFDHDGVMGCHITEIKGTEYLYYIGWNLAESVPFRNAIGIAKYEHNKFERIYDGPVLDRSIYDPCFVASNCVIKINGQYIMYYLSCIKWIEEKGKMKHLYHIKIAESDDGINWNRNGKIAIDFHYPNEYAISVPRVISEYGIYKMWYSYRAGAVSETYRIGYAESEDGFNWNRKDEKAGIELSNEGWDSTMICYPYLFDYNDRRFMLYNGNGYGLTGFGLAVME